MAFKKKEAGKSSINLIDCLKETDLDPLELKMAMIDRGTRDRWMTPVAGITEINFLPFYFVMRGW